MNRFSTSMVAQPSQAEKFRPTERNFSAILLAMNGLVHFFTQRLEAEMGC